MRDLDINAIRNIKIAFRVEIRREMQTCIRIQIYKDGGGMVEKKRRGCKVSVITILYTFFFCFTSFAQPESECPHGTHEYVSQLLVPATEQEQGQVKNTCIYCGEVSTEYLPATGHAFGPWETTQEGENHFERRTCSRCGRSEERELPITVVVPEKPPAGTKAVWRANNMDYVLTAATGGVWGYAAVVLWWNSLVLIWYKEECLRKKKERKNDVE